MVFVKSRKFQLTAAGLILLVIIIAAVLLTRRAGEIDSPASDRGTGTELADSFTFFDLGANTRLNRGIRKRLADHLGSDAIEKRGLIDLTLQPAGLLESGFQTLRALHHSLNGEVRARIEHNVTRLTYRYPWQQNTPFKFVQLVFSNYNAKPLYFRIILKKEGAAIIDTIREKYGTPGRADSGSLPVSVLYWEKNTDYLIVSELKDRFGDPEYHVMICYANNLRLLIATEKTEAERRERQLRQAGKTAF